MKNDLILFLPSLVLIGTIVLLFFIAFLGDDRDKKIIPVVGVFGLLLMMIANGFQYNLDPARYFSGMVTFDGMAYFFNYLFGGAAILAILFSVRQKEVVQTDESSYYTLVVATTLGMMLLAASSHLLMLYLSLEFVSVLSYILTGSIRGSRRSSEAALKYVIYGGVASGIMAYGISLLYGLTGTMEFFQIAEFLREHAVSRPVLFLSLLLIMAGIGYKRR
ncbi:MAG: hypothetical protein HYY44_06160 [Deltaproteobacteria bacterium]|nr:hypothetical protein [Deltaproteobacteria bacterium]